MKRFATCVFFGLLILLLFPASGLSCTTFRIDHDDRYYFGRNYDWMVGDALLIVNKRGVVKNAALASYDEAIPASWTSKYGSVTFNQYGCGFPTGGMNEAGLVVETMMLSDTVYPAADARPGVKASQWRQYQLDSHSTVDQVIASDSKIRVLGYRDASSVGVHFLVSDKTGKCAAIEFLDGKMVVHTGVTMPVMALANTTYAESVEYWKKGAAPEYDRWGSVARFMRAASMVSAYGGGGAAPPVDYAFDILDKVSDPVRTKWSIVYDQNDLRIHFITDVNKKTRSVDLNKFDFSCRTDVRVLDANADFAGDVTDKFRDYSWEINRDLIRASFGKTPFLQSIPPEVLERISRYPNSLVCKE